MNGDRDDGGAFARRIARALAIGVRWGSSLVLWAG